MMVLIGVQEHFFSSLKWRTNRRCFWKKESEGGHASNRNLFGDDKYTFTIYGLCQRETYPIFVSVAKRKFYR